MRTASILTVCLAAACVDATTPVSAQVADDAFYTAAYDACVAALKPHLATSGSAGVVFAPAEKVTGKYEDEFSISFPLGAISGADLAAPHPVTMLDKPVGSCWGLPGERMFTRIILNGAPLSGASLRF
jgi:hypothetical protein